METLEVKKLSSSHWRDRSVFVSGATGLLGGCLVAKLCELGAQVTCLIRDWVPTSELVRSTLIEKTNVVRGDACDESLIERILGEYEVSTVFGLAAQTTVPIANRNPLSTFETNVAGTWRLLEACRRSPTVKQIVVPSSDKAYGEHADLPYVEGYALQGRNPYDASKSCADLIAQSYAKSFVLPVAITRCGNFFGGGDLNWNRLVPGTIRSILRGQDPVIRSDGNMVRDYFYVEDAAYANMLLAEKMESDSRLIGEAFNFSYEEPLTVIEMTNLILKLMGSNLKPVIENSARGEIQRQYLSSAKARRILEWQPAFSLEEGLMKTIEWYKKLLGNRSFN